jgi:hypothetical protein
MVMPGMAAAETPAPAIPAATLFEQSVHGVANFFQRAAQLAEARGIAAEFFVAKITQRFDCGEARIEIFFGLKVKRFGRLDEGFVEDFRRKLLLVVDLGLTSFALLVVLALLFVTDGTRFFVFEPIVSGLGERSGLEGDFQRAADELHRADAEFEVAVFHRRIERVPEILDEIRAKIQALQQTGKAFGIEQGLGKPGRELKVFAPGSKRFLCEFGGLREVGEFALVLPVTLGELVVLTACLFDLVVDQEFGVMAEVNAARIIARNGAQKIFAQWHGQVPDQSAVA